MIKYPYTDFHEMNLDWLLEKVKNNEIDIETLKEIVEALQPGAENLVERVTALESGTMTIGGQKTFSQNLRIKGTSASATLPSLIFIPASSDNTAGRLGARLNALGQMLHFEFREQSTNTETGLPSEYYEVYRLPDVDEDLSANVGYEIITTKNNGEHSKDVAAATAQYISSTEGVAEAYTCFYVAQVDSNIEFGIIVNGRASVVFVSSGFAGFLKQTAAGTTRCAIRYNDGAFSLKIIDIFGTAQLE